MTGFSKTEIQHIRKNYSRFLRNININMAKMAKKTDLTNREKLILIGADRDRKVIEHIVKKL